MKKPPDASGGLSVLHKAAAFRRKTQKNKGYGLTVTMSKYKYRFSSSRTSCICSTYALSSRTPECVHVTV